jgi:hypothetical protein
MANLLRDVVPVFGRERKYTMRKSNERAVDSAIYARISEARMNELERHSALSTLRSAELIVDVIVWAQERVAAFGHYFLKPSLKH